jgi:hypothetical protein
MRDLNRDFEPLYDVTGDSGEPGATPYIATVRVDVQKGDLRVTSRAPVFLRVNGDNAPACRCSSAQAREIGEALIAAAELAPNHAV